MAQSRKKKPKSTGRTGRPKVTGNGKPLVVRMQPPQIKAIDQWIGKTEITRQEAIRQLVAWALDRA